MTDGQFSGRLVNRESSPPPGERPEKGENINRIANQLTRRDDSRTKPQGYAKHYSLEQIHQEQQDKEEERTLGHPVEDFRLNGGVPHFPQQVLHGGFNFATRGQQIVNFKNQSLENRRLSEEEYSSHELPESPMMMHMQMQRQAMAQSYSPEHSNEYEEGTKKRKRYEDEASELEDLEQFAKDFKQKRIKMGYTQGDVGVAMGKLYGNDFSQTTISRFEALNLSVKNMCKLKPLLQRWLIDVENALARGEMSEAGRLSIPQQLIPPHQQPILSGRRRKKRTSIPTDGKNKLEDGFRKNPKPTSEEIRKYSEDLKMDREVVRVWFCNRRQKQKRIQLQYTEEDGSPPASPTHGYNAQGSHADNNAMPSSPLSEDETFHSLQHLPSIVQSQFGNGSHLNEPVCTTSELIAGSAVKAVSVPIAVPAGESPRLPPTLLTTRPNVIRPGLNEMYSPPPLRHGPQNFTPHFFAPAGLAMKSESMS